MTTEVTSTSHKETSLASLTEVGKNIGMKVVKISQLKECDNYGIVLVFVLSQTTFDTNRTFKF